MKLKIVGIVICLVLAWQQMLAQSVSQKATQLIKSNEKNLELIEEFFSKDKVDSSQLKHWLVEAESQKADAIRLYINNELGEYVRDLNRYSEAINYHNQALNMALENQDSLGMARCYNLIGVVYRRQENIILSLKFHHKALEILENINDTSHYFLKTKAITFNSIGNILVSIEQYDNALEYFNKSIAIEQKVSNNLGLAINYQNIGDILIQKNKPEDAKKHFELSLNYNTLINSNFGKMICYSSLCQLF